MRFGSAGTQRAPPAAPHHSTAHPNVVVVDAAPLVVICSNKIMLKVSLAGPDYATPCATPLKTARRRHCRPHHHHYDHLGRVDVMRLHVKIILPKHRTTPGTGLETGAAQQRQQQPQ